MSLTILIGIAIVYLIGFLSGYQISGRKMFNVFKNIMKEHPDDTMKEWYDVIKNKNPSIFRD